MTVLNVKMSFEGSRNRFSV